MRKLGLIGGTGPESTVIYYRELTSGVQKRLNRNMFPYLTIESLSVFDVLDYCNRNDYTGLIAYLTQGVRNLAAAGAEIAAFTGITPHIVYDEVLKRSPIPIISMVQTSCQYAKKKRNNRIALLGTLPTMNGDFFQRPFREDGIKVIVPKEDERQYIGHVIETELEYGIVKSETKHMLKQISLRLIEEEKVEAIVLGCTELPLAFDEISLPVEKMDVMRIHIDTLIDEIIRN